MDRYNKEQKEKLVPYLKIFCVGLKAYKSKEIDSANKYPELLEALFLSDNYNSCESVANDEKFDTNLKFVKNFLKRMNKTVMEIAEEIFKDE